MTREHQSSPPSSLLSTPRTWWRLARHFGVPPEQLHDVAQEVAGCSGVLRQLESLNLSSRPLKP